MARVSEGGGSARPFIDIVLLDCKRSEVRESCVFTAITQSWSLLHRLQPNIVLLP